MTKWIRDIFQGRRTAMTALLARQGADEQDQYLTRFMLRQNPPKPADLREFEDIEPAEEEKDMLSAAWLKASYPGFFGELQLQVDQGRTREAILGIVSEIPGINPTFHDNIARTINHLQKNAAG